MGDSNPVEIQIPLPSGCIHGCWYGNRQERPILALHGWQDNAGSYALLAPLLSKHVAILAIDLPGHGRSYHNPPGIMYHTPRYALIIKEIMLYYKWPKVSLMGHSMGSAVSFYFSALHPQLVDVLITLDVMHTRYFSPEMQVQVLYYISEKFLQTIDRKLDSHSNDIEPPSYKLEEMQELLHRAAENSIDLNKTKYILERNIRASQVTGNEGKFYFSRDEAIKSMGEFYSEPGLTLEMAKRMVNIKWLALKAGDSYHINENLPITREILDFQKENNTGFSFQVIPGVKHHGHLNNPEVVAQYILPFLQKYRQPEPFVFTGVTNDLKSHL